MDRLRRRFAIGQLCIVADRGMIRSKAIAALEARRLLYMRGVRDRSDKLVRDVVLNDAAPFVPLGDREAQAGHPLWRQGSRGWAGQRYIVCINHQQAEKDAADRAAILASLERQLPQEATRHWLATPAIRRFLKTAGEGHFAIDRSQGG